MEFNCHLPRPVKVGGEIIAIERTCLRLLLEQPLRRARVAVEDAAEVVRVRLDRAQVVLEREQRRAPHGRRVRRAPEREVAVQPHEVRVRDRYARLEPRRLERVSRGREVELVRGSHISRGELLGSGGVDQS